MNLKELEELEALLPTNAELKEETRRKKLSDSCSNITEEVAKNQAEGQRKRKEAGWQSKMIGNTNGSGRKGKKYGPQTAESNAKRSASLMGRKIPSITGVPQPKETCPHCGKVGGRPQMKQWHFDKCKVKK